jgi:pimeloyl-ACP methyl ester carboxylesterase
VHVILVHGAYHGSWCWDLLTPELERQGLRVTAVDLPISDPAAGTAAYASTVVDAIDAADETVLVGHSMAGLVLPLVAEQRPVRRMVFLAAMLPIPGRSLADQRRDEPLDSRTAPTTSDWTDLGDDVWMVGHATATEIFYHDAPPPLAEWATARLRPQAYRYMSEPSPLVAWPDVERDYIVCRDDRAIDPDWGRGAARNRLGVQAIEIDGGHSPFLTRPVELAAVLGTIIG